MKKRHKRKKRMAFVDLLPFLALVLLAFGTLLVTWLMQMREGEELTVRYTLLLEGMETEGAWTTVEAGDLVTSENGTAPLGKVTARSIRPHKAATVREGSVILLEDPLRVDVEICVEARGRLQAGEGLRVSGIRIAAGGVGSFRIGAYYAATARIIFADSEE